MSFHLPHHLLPSFLFLLSKFSLLPSNIEKERVEEEKEIKIRYFLLPSFFFHSFDSIKFYERKCFHEKNSLTGKFLVVCEQYHMTISDFESCYGRERRRERRRKESKSERGMKLDGDVILPSNIISFSPSPNILSLSPEKERE